MVGWLRMNSIQGFFPWRVVVAYEIQTPQPQRIAYCFKRGLQRTLWRYGVGAVWQSRHTPCRI
jgi:hypothetical protein